MGERDEKDLSLNESIYSIYPFQDIDIDQRLILPKKVTFHESDWKRNVSEDLKSEMKKTIFSEEEKNELDEFCDKSILKRDYSDIISVLGGVSDFSSVWPYLKYEATKPKWRKDAPITEKCGLYVFGDWLKHDHNNNILLNKERTRPEGWICPDNPFDVNCKFVPLRSNKERFIRWVELLNDGRTDYAYSKSEIVEGSPHWELQEKHKWEFALPEKTEPNYSEKVKRFIDRMNQHAGMLLLERRGRGKIKSEIKKEEKESKSKSPSEMFTPDMRKPLIFTFKHWKKYVLVPEDERNATETSYLMRNYDKKTKEIIEKNYTFNDEEREILKKLRLSDYRKEIKRKERDLLRKQLSSLASHVSEAVKEIASDMNLCGKNEKDPVVRFNINESAMKKKANHFNFSISVCPSSPTYMRMFSVSPLFKGWANRKSINEKLVTIDTPRKAVNEYISPKEDTPLKTTDFDTNKKVYYSDNTPLVFSMTTGVSMLDTFSHSFKPIKAKVMNTREKTLYGSKFTSSSEFHKCVFNSVSSEISKRSTLKEDGFPIFKINGTKAFPMAIETTITKVKHKDGKVKSFYGMGIDWVVIPTDFYTGHIGTIFNYKHEEGLSDLKRFLKMGYDIENKAMQKCLVQSTSN